MILNVGQIKMITNENKEKMKSIKRRKNERDNKSERGTTGRKTERNIEWFRNYGHTQTHKECCVWCAHKTGSGFLLSPPCYLRKLIYQKISGMSGNVSIFACGKRKPVVPVHQ